MAAYNWQNVNVGNPNAGSPYAAYATQLRNSMTDPIMKAINSMQTVAQANADATNKKDMFEKELSLAKQKQKMDEAYKNAQIASLKQAMKQDNLPWEKKQELKMMYDLMKYKKLAEWGIKGSGSSGRKSGSGKGGSEKNTLDMLLDYTKKAGYDPSTTPFFGDVESKNLMETARQIDALTDDPRIKQRMIEDSANRPIGGSWFSDLTFDPVNTDDAKGVYDTLANIQKMKKEMYYK